MDFGIHVWELQRKKGRRYILEQPRTATSWNEPRMQKLLDSEGSFTVDLDQCCFQLRDPVSRKLYKKPTRLVTNVEGVKKLGRNYNGKHEHEKIEGKVKVSGCWQARLRCAQVYPKLLVDGFVEVLRGLKKHNENQVLVSERLDDDHEHLKTSVMSAHVNLAHPSKERFFAHAEISWSWRESNCVCSSHEV